MVMFFSRTYKQVKFVVVVLDFVNVVYCFVCIENSSQSTFRDESMLIIPPAAKRLWMLWDFYKSITLGIVFNVPVLPSLDRIIRLC